MIKIGVVATIAYIAAIIALRWNDFHSLEALQRLKLNELGDFLAGVFGPLSFFWLIIGYVQQQKELMLNTEALRLQADELKNSVEQQRELVAATRNQIEVDKQSAERTERALKRAGYPMFSIINSGWQSKSGNSYEYYFVIVNSGAPASNVELMTEPSIVQLNRKYALFDRNDKKEIFWDTVRSGPAPSELKLVITCKDSNEEAYFKAFDLRQDEECHYKGIALPA